jgi:hypothetical protein
LVTVEDDAAEPGNRSEIPEVNESSKPLELGVGVGLASVGELLPVEDGITLIEGVAVPSVLVDELVLAAPDARGLEAPGRIPERFEATVSRRPDELAVGVGVASAGEGAATDEEPISVVEFALGSALSVVEPAGVLDPSVTGELAVGTALVELLGVPRTPLTRLPTPLKASPTTFPLLVAGVDEAGGLWALSEVSAVACGEVCAVGEGVVAELSGVLGSLVTGELTVGTALAELLGVPRTPLTRLPTPLKASPTTFPLLVAGVDEADRVWELSEGSALACGEVCAVDEGVVAELSGALVSSVAGELTVGTALAELLGVSRTPLTRLPTPPKASPMTFPLLVAGVDEAGRVWELSEVSVLA